MQSKHAWIFVLLAGAVAFVIALGSLLTIDLLDVATPYLETSSWRNMEASKPLAEAPRLINTINGATVEIVEIDKNGEPVRTLYSADLTDDITDFSLFAVPQTTYEGIIYVQSLQDIERDLLIIYPMSASTGKLSPAVLRTESNKATLSRDQTRVAVILASAKQVAAYDLATGLLLSTWTLKPQEQFADTTPTLAAYDGTGVEWVSSDCFQHHIVTGDTLEQRLFCLEGEGL